MNEVKLKQITVKFKVGERFSRDIFIAKCGFDMKNKSRLQKRTIERNIGETLRMLSDAGYILQVGNEKSIARGRPSIAYQALKGLKYKITHYDIEQDVICPFCHEELELKKTHKFCPNCGRVVR